jgi:hypothetical protein
VPFTSAVSREAIATPAASSEAELIRLPVDSRAMDISISRLTLDAAAAACRAALLVAIPSAIFFSF